MKKFLMLCAIISVALSSGAIAGSNECDGTIKVGEEWTTITGEIGDYAPNGCRFKTKSKMGRRILKTCPDKSECVISFPLGVNLDKGAPAPEASTCDVARYGADACWKEYTSYLDRMKAVRPTVTITTAITGVVRIRP
jgi:hypothetical protein